MAEFGSFGNVSPEGMQAIRNAIARRQQGDQSPALNQQSAVSATPAPLPPQPQGGVGLPAVPAATPTTSLTLPTGEQSEAVIIIKALGGRLKALSDMGR